MSISLTRRQFVGRAWAAGVLVPGVARSASAPATQRVRLGLIGCGGRGRELLEVFCQFPDVQIVAICDLIEPRLQQTEKLLAGLPRPQKPDRSILYQTMLERKDLDAVLIATMEHWHALPFIHAAQAGKHIYVEKPLSHTVAEGRAMVEAAQQAGIIALMGTQQRGYPHFQQAVEVIRSGRLGKIPLVECWNYHNVANRVGRPADSEPPPGYHWDQWLGPAPLVPFNRARLASSWWFDYGGGMMTNWAIHHIDTILWAIQADQPESALCAGGKLVVDDLADTPDCIEASWHLPGLIMHYGYRGFNNFHTVQSRPHNHGICFHGTNATMVLDRSGYEIWEDRNPGKSVDRQDNPRHWRDGKPGNEVDGPWQRLFLDCIKAGKQPPVDLKQSHRATVCCHLANIAYRVGRAVRWDAANETIPGDPEAAALLNPPRRKGYELPAALKASPRA
ncbi:MAG: Gfo/Idh/MocA family protein [Thermoguttaceae bacterium]